MDRFLATLLFVTAYVVPGVADVCVYKPPSVRHIAGVVVDSSGRPIPGVNLSIIERGEPIASAMTGDKGRFRFDSLKDGAYELAATANGFQSARYRYSSAVPQSTGTDRCKLNLRSDSGIVAETSKHSKELGILRHIADSWRITARQQRKRG